MIFYYRHGVNCCEKVPAEPGRSRPITRRIDFNGINHSALAVLPLLLGRWLPGGRWNGSEYIALNPRRDDRHLGSFAVNLRSGRWGDFASGDKGGDVISLAAYLFGLRQGEAARRIAAMLGLR